MKIQTKFFVLMIAILASLSFSVWLFSQHYIDRMNEQWAIQLAERHVQFDKQRTLQPMIREISIARKLAAEPAIIKMALNDNDAALKQQAIKVLEEYRLEFRDHTYFAALSKTGHYYFNDIDNQFENKQLRYTLSSKKLSDKWFFATLSADKDYQLNVDASPQLGVTKIWINVLIKQGSQVLGVVGTGIDITDFLKETVDITQPGIHNLFVDDDMAIQLYRDHELIDYSSISKEDRLRNKVDLLLKDATDIKNLRQMMAQLKTSDKKIGTLWVTFEGEKHLLGVAHLPELGWYDLTIMDAKNVSFSDDLTSAVMLLGSLFLLSLVAIGLMLHRWVLSPIIQLQDAMSELQHGRYDIHPPLVGSGEILQLSKSFQTMVEFVRNTNSALEETVRQRTKSLRESEGLFRSMIEAIPDTIYLKDNQSRWLVVNEPAKRRFQLHDIAWQGKTEMEIAELHPEFRIAHEKCLFNDVKTWESGELSLFNETSAGKDGQMRDFEIRKMPIYDDQGRPEALLTIGRDITESRQAENELRVAAIAFEAQEGMLVTNAQNIILRVNKAFTAITGYSAEESIGKTPQMLQSDRQDTAFYAAMWDSIASRGSWDGEIWNRRKNGEVYPEHLTITAVKNDNGIVTNYVATLTDITLSKAASEEIKNLAFYDPLTSLPNRRLLFDRVNQALVSSARSGRDGALLFLDLDHFKTLNDTLGHNMGDLLLQQVAKRLVACVREGDTVARLGGDEFVIMLEDLSEHALEAASQAEIVGEKILAALVQPYQLAAHEYQSTPSIGVALFSDHNQSQEDLLKHADIAMYQAKKAGRNTLRFFDPHMQDAINIRVDLERELRKAIIQKQFQLYYQVQVDSTGRALGAEALIRWIHPLRGMVSPFDFIPLAEDTGLIVQIGQWVLETACAQLQAWQQTEHTKALTLSINVSAKQFLQVDFAAQVINAIQRYEIDPMLLKLELTESILLDHLDEIISTMNALKEIGIRFSLDDFGTGYSSLQYLKLLPLYQLKIDQSFVRDLAIDNSDKAIVLTVIIMAHSLDLNVIAEGVETEDQRQLLLDNGCTHYQGYLFSKPVPIEQFELLLRVDQNYAA